ncbi:ATP-binding protein [Acerihabitans sp. TG2]|uniref:AAA family ATPase n=1 Tax=Acerihabitans sp. TG2 TaxID=3096008 RepID=UPI002B22E224|nr:ATP-binding protein [Acerihabitans sp. TG2]MEA9390410.1 ATP-binding protein [Acerihabitans sp. TG2]
MIIEFSLKNFYSFAQTQTISLNSSRLKGLDASTIKLTYPNKLELLRSAVIYGANAAGKSNFFLGLRVMHNIIINSASESQSGDELPIVPFKLDSELIDKPSEFEISFISNNIRYQYGFTATSSKIHDEWLFAWPKGRPQKWFMRAWNNKKNEYEWEMGSALLGDKHVWQKATRSNALFLSTAMQLNSEQLKPVFDWFKNTLRVSTLGGWNEKFSSLICTRDKKEEVLNFLKAADVGIDDIIVTKEKFNPASLPNSLPENLKQLVIKNNNDVNTYKIQTVHKNNNNELMLFDLKDESEGTKKLFSLAGPWLDTLDKGHVIFIDELNLSLHPKLVRFLVSLFNDPDKNTNNAQLIFTTHETSILNQEVFRRDQIWFCEKDNANATKLFPLTDFSPRKGRENIETSYLDGRYGAIPFIKKMEM